MKPRRTEYRGIEFASKAEARFALFLDNQGVDWWYGPPALKLSDGYVPDFVLLRLHKVEDNYDRSTNRGNSTAELTVIEYKPKRPTESYISELAGRFCEIGDRLHSEKMLDFMLDCVVNSNFVLMIGGMGYEKSEHLNFHWGPPGEMWGGNRWHSSWGHVFDGVDPDYENARLAGYRFDLEASAT